MNLGPRTRFFLGATGLFILLGLVLRAVFLLIFGGEPVGIAEPFYIGFNVFSMVVDTYRIFLLTNHCVQH